MKDDLEKLKGFSVLPVKDLLAEDMLFSVGLSLTRPEVTEVVANPEPQPRANRRRKTGETSSRRVRARTGVSSNSAPAPASGVLALASPAPALSEDSEDIPLSQLLLSPARPPAAPLDSQGLQITIIPPAPIDQDQIMQGLLAEALPAGAISVEEISSPELALEAGPGINAVEDVPAEAAATSSVPIVGPAAARRRRVAEDPTVPRYWSSNRRQGLSQESSALGDDELAQELFVSTLLPADAKQIVNKPLKHLRKDAVQNILRVNHQINFLFERVKSLKKEVGTWKGQAETLQVFKKSAVQEITGLKGAVDDLQQKATAGVRAIRDSRVEVATLTAKLEALTASRSEDQAVLAAQAAEIEKLKAEHAVATSQSAEIEKLKAECAVATSQAAASEKARAAAEERANFAVAEFRKSREFEDEKIEFSSFAYTSGVDEIQKRVAARYPNIDWDLVYTSDDSNPLPSSAPSTP